ncbi:MAG: 3,4-dihydroxy-2-butanone-4-phosphate synthase [Alphaproteobacteria bacterium]|nr:3,4-dihydroxy-2-butanone-4-phosphate synthase [Alphaproteobacteria bacterium]
MGRTDVSYKEYLSSIEELAEDQRNGRMVILVDDENRENEGDLVIPAQMATPAAVNFMAKHGRGLICLALPRNRVEQLRLPLMPRQNETRHSTAFTVSIEAREGVSTGISAPDRARTIAVAIDPNSTWEDIVTPGHIFPLLARDGGVLVRAGHTEASVDLARLAGLNASAVICEIMNDDGSMARLPDLVQFAQFHGIKIGQIADLIAYRLRHENAVTRQLGTTLQSVFGGDFRMYVYSSVFEYVEHIALVKGDVGGSDPVLVRMHAVNVLEDLLGDRNTRGKGQELHTAMQMIGQADRGVMVLLRESRPTSVTERIKARVMARADGTVSETDIKPAFGLREYGIGAQILLDLGIRNLILLSNRKRTIVGLSGYGLKVVEQRPIPMREA